MLGYFEYPYHRPRVFFLWIGFLIRERSSNHNRYYVGFLSSINFCAAVLLYFGS